VLRSSDSGVIRFRGTRQFAFTLVYFSICTFVSLLILASVWTSSNVPKATYNAFFIPLVVILLAAIVRSFKASTIEIHQRSLIYRTLIRTKTFQSNEIVEIGVEKKIRGLVRLWQPYLRLKSGKTFWLHDLSAGIRSQIGVDDQYGERMSKMMESLHSWLSASGGSAESLLR
jgi:hypothetical protein